MSEVIDRINYDKLWESKAPKIYELVIKADTNDADYVYSTSKVSIDDIEAMKPIIEMIKNYKGNRGSDHNWCVGEISRKGEEPLEIYPELTEAAFEWFNDRVPHGEYGVHTIESIEYYPLPEKIKLL